MAGNGVVAVAMYGGNSIKSFIALETMNFMKMFIKKLSVGSVDW